MQPCTTGSVDGSNRVFWCNPVKPLLSVEATGARGPRCTSYGSDSSEKSGSWRTYENEKIMQFTYGSTAMLHAICPVRKKRGNFRT